MNFIIMLFAFLVTINLIGSLVALDQVICYYGSWSKYRSGRGKFQIEDIDSEYCTVIIYSFIGLHSDGTINGFDAENDLANFRLLKNANADVKLLVAIGGWNEGSSIYSQVAASPALRQNFVRNVVNFIIRHNLDGLDFDWEYPALRGGNFNDKQNFVILLKELRESFAQYNWLLTAAVGAGNNLLSSSYDVVGLNKYLDYINIMTYDFHGSWESVTGIHSPLYSSPNDYTGLNQNASIHNWINAGASSKKILLGLAAYGRSFTLTNPNNNEIQASASGAGPAGVYSGEPGMLTYLEICEKINSGGYTQRYLDDQKAVYAFKGTEWIGFDNVRSITEKVNYAKTMNLAGVMIWSIESDDRSGFCGQGSYPLLSAIQRAFNTTSVTTTTNTPSIIIPPANYMSPKVANIICKLRKNGLTFGNPINQCTNRYYRCLRLTPDSFLAVDTECPTQQVYDELNRRCTSPQNVSKCQRFV